MDKKEKEKPEPSFPAPYEPFNEELAFDIYELRQSQKEYEKIKSELKNAHGNLKNVSMYDLNYKNKEATLLYYQQNERLLEEKIAHHYSKTYGYMEAVLAKTEAEPEIAQEVMRVLDEKVHPEKYENKSPNEEKQLKESTKDANSKETKAEKTDPNKEIFADPKEKNSQDKTDYYLSLIQKSRDDQEKRSLKSEDKIKEMEKSQLNQKESIPNAGYLNYQLNYQKPVYNERASQDKVNEVSKNKKDISLDKD